MRESLDSFLRLFGGMALLVRQIISELIRGPFYFRLLIDQIYLLGLRSGPLVFITAASTGMVMALQFGLGLQKFGANFTSRR